MRRVGDHPGENYHLARSILTPLCYGRYWEFDSTLVSRDLVFSHTMYGTVHLEMEHQTCKLQRGHLSAKLC